MSFIYSIEKTLENRASIHSYTAEFKYIPESFILYGSDNHLSWFIIDEVLKVPKNIQNNIHAINRVIDNNLYFRFYRLEAKLDSLQNDQAIEIAFIGKESDDNIFHKIISPSFTNRIDRSTNIDYSKQFGLIETLIHNNFHTYITTHRSNNSDESTNTGRNYSIFSNYIHPKEDLKVLDPRPKGIYEFIFQSFYIQSDSLFFRKKQPETVFTIEYLDSNDEWNQLFHSEVTNDIYPLNGKQIYGIRFDTHDFNLKSFDFIGTVEITEKSQIIPSSYSAFPFWGTNVNGIINAIKEYTLTTATNSGLFEAVGQYDTNDDSQKSFLRGMYSSFEEYDDTTSSITFRFGFKIRLSNYLVQVPERTLNERNRNPHRWKLEGSNDEIDWTLLSEIEDNIFDTDTEAVVYRTTNTSDYFSSFRIVKFDDCIGNDDVRFNQLILYQIEFFGIISPFYSKPSFFWELPVSKDCENEPYSFFEKDSSVQPIIPIDLCNGILGCLNYYGSSINQKETVFTFEYFVVNLVGMAFINPPEDLSVSLHFVDSEEVTKIEVFDNENETFDINDEVVFFKFPEIELNVYKIVLSSKIDGVELFGFVSNDSYRKRLLITPGKSFEFEFPLNFQLDILHSLIDSEFNKYDYKSKIETSFVSIEASKSLNIRNLPCKIVKSDEENEKFVLFDFIDSRLSLNSFAICCDKLESLNLKGSNDDGKTFEDVLFFRKIHRNHSSKTFLFKSENQKPYKLFKLEKLNAYREIDNVKFYGVLQLIKPKLREQLKLRPFEKNSISLGLDIQNGILNALKNFPFEKVEKENSFVIDFIEISVAVREFSLISFNQSLSAKFLKIEGLNEAGEWCFLYNNPDAKNLSGDMIFLTENSMDVSVIKISTDDKSFDFTKIEFFGEIHSSRPNPIRKKPPNFEFILNPFNGILNSKLFEYKKTNHFHFTSIEFNKDVRIVVNKVFIEFGEPLKNDFFIEASNDSLNWHEIEFKIRKASPRKAECDVIYEYGFRVFHIYSISSFDIQKVELFGKTFKNKEKEKSGISEKILTELSSEKVVNIEYNKKKPFNGLFYTMSHFFSSLSIPLSFKGTKGNEENPASLFDYHSDSVVSFTNTSKNVICIRFKLAKIKLSKYLISVGPNLFPNSYENKWTLEVSDDMKNWTVIDSIETISDDIEIFNINTKIELNNRFYCNFRFVFDSPIVLRKIEFFGGYLPNSQEENMPVIKNQPIMLRKNRFSGILTSMCQLTNPFEKGFIKTAPTDLPKIILSQSRQEEVIIESAAAFEFIESELNLNCYSIETTMKNWSVEVNSMNEYSGNENWTEIHCQTDFQNCGTFIIQDCPNFTKIRFLNNDKKPQKLRRIEFFGSIKDKVPTKQFRYDIMNGILSSLASYPSSVFNKEITVKSSDYRFTNPIQIFDRNHVNRLFCFVPSSKQNSEEPKQAFVILEFWKKALKIEKYSIIFNANSNVKNLKIEGANPTANSSENKELNWEEIDFLNEEEIKENNFLFKTSKSSQFFQFIRISSTDEFSFKNIEFFGDCRRGAVRMPKEEASQKDSLTELDDKDVIARFPLMPAQSTNKVLKRGFLHNGKVKLNGFIQVLTSKVAANSMPVQHLFKNSPSNGHAVFEKGNQFIELNFLTASFQMTHFFIDCKTKDAKVEIIADKRSVFAGSLVWSGNDASDSDDQISVKRIISLPVLEPALSLEFKFLTNESMEIGYFEIYGNLVPQNRSPDRLISLGRNRITLPFKNSTDGFDTSFGLMAKRRRFDIFKSGVIGNIAKNSGGSLINSRLISAYERYEGVEKWPVPVDANSPSAFSFGNSPQVTFDFGSCALAVEEYALESEMRNWILEGSKDGGKSWFLVDVQYSKDLIPKPPSNKPRQRIRPALSPRASPIKPATATVGSGSNASDSANEKAKLFCVKKEPKKRFASLLRLTNMDSLFEGFYDKSLVYQKVKSDGGLRHSCGIGRIEFYGDFEMNLPKQGEVRASTDESNSSSNNNEGGESNNEIGEDDESLDDEGVCKPLKNLIFYPPHCSPNRKEAGEKSEDKKKNEEEEDPNYDYDYDYDLVDYDYECEETVEEAESNFEESETSSSTENEISLEREFGAADFSNLSISDMLRIFRIVNTNQNNDDEDSNDLYFD